MKEHLQWRCPPLIWRVELVAITLAAPGAVAGGLVGLVLGAFPLGAAVGAFLGAVLGAWMESHTAASGRPSEGASEKR